MTLVETCAPEVDSGWVVDSTAWLLLYEVENPEPLVSKLKKLLAKLRVDCTGAVVTVLLGS